MADFAKIKRNIQRMLDQNAPEADIDAYVASEGVTPDELRSAPKGSASGIASAPAPDGSQMSQAEFDQMAAATEAKDHGGYLSTIYRDFIEPWVPSGLPDFSQRGPVERAGDAMGFAASVPVRMLTGGEYGAGDLARGLGATDTGATLDAGERDFVANNGKQIQSVTNLGDVAMGLPAKMPRHPAIPPQRSIFSINAPKVKNPLPATVTARLTQGGEGVADAYLATTLQRAGMTGEDVLSELSKGQQAARFGNASGTMPETVADVLGDAGQRALRATVTAPGPASTIAKQALDARQKGGLNPYALNPKAATVGEEMSTFGQRQRILDNLSRALEVRSRGTAYQTEKLLDQKLQAESAPAYRAAWKEANDFDLTPATTALMEEAANLQGARSNTVMKALKLFQINEAPQGQPHVYRTLGRADELRRFDSAKRGLDDMIATQKIAGNRELAAILNKFRVDLLNAVHGGDSAAPAVNLAYAKARGLYASGARMREAIEMGRRALNEGAEVTVDEFRALSPGEQKMFRLGLYEQARRLLGNQKDTNDATQLFRKPNVAELLKAVIPQAKSKGAKTKGSEQFGDLLERERRMGETRNSALYGSKTAATLADTEDLTRWARIATRLRTQGVVSTVADESVNALVQMFGLRSDAAEHLARMLLTSDPEQVAQIMRRIETQYGPQKAQQAMVAVYQPKAARTIAGAGLRGFAAGQSDQQRNGGRQ